MLKYLTKSKNLFFIIIFLSFFINETMSKTKENYSDFKQRIFNENLNRFLNCTNNKVELIPYYYSKYKNYIFVFKDLNLDCLSTINEIMSKKNKGGYEKVKFDKSFQINLVSSIEDDIFYEIISLKNPLPFYGPVFNHSYGNENIIKVGNNFYYMHDSNGGWNNKGIIQKKNLIKFSIDTSTYTGNFFLNIEKSFFGYLPDGNVTLYNSYYKVYGQKTYFIGGGAFWYNAKRSYKGDLLQLIPEETHNLLYTKRCIPINRFYKEIKNYLLKMNVKEYCPFILKE
jgi:hypothetical protein